VTFSLSRDLQHCNIVKNIIISLPITICLLHSLCFTKYHGIVFYNRNVWTPSKRDHNICFKMFNFPILKLCLLSLFIIQTKCIDLYINSVTHEEKFYTTPDFKIKMQVFTLNFNVSVLFNHWYFVVRIYVYINVSNIVPLEEVAISPFLGFPNGKK
jgi:hypothetical protein